MLWENGLYALPNLSVYPLTGARKGEVRGGREGYEVFRESIRRKKRDGGAH